MAKTKRAHKKGQKEKRSVATIHDNFMENLRGLEIFVNNVAPVAERHDVTSREKAGEILERAFKAIGLNIAEMFEGKGNGNSQEIAVEPTDKEWAQFVSGISGLRKLSPVQAGLLYKSSFVMLLSYFDFLISDLLHCFYQIYPDSLSGKDLSLNLNELKYCADLDEAMDYLITKEVENVLYKNLEGQRRYLKEQLKIEIKEDMINWARLDEAMGRRNIIVHNNSRINRRYLRNVEIAIVPEGARELKEGKELTVSPDYFHNILDEVCIAGSILTQYCWRKWAKDDIEKADQSLITDCLYNALLDEKWHVAERLGLFAMECKHASEANRLHCHVNYCQALKWQGKEKQLAKGLEQLEVESLSPKYKIAYYALMGDSTAFFENIENAVLVDKMTETDFMDWPLFRELRQRPEYAQRIKAACASANGEKQS